MHIVADEAIGWVRDAFDGLGRLQTLPGPAIDAAAVRDADVLLTRTVTRVDEALLSGSRVRFVGSCTAGVDHVDRGWLQRNGIAFAHAPGCNARAVAEYVVTALCVLWAEDALDAPRDPVVVVGFGAIGRIVTALLRALGREVRVCDPPLAEQQGVAPSTERFWPLDEALEGARAVTLHVPLIHDGAHPTAHLLDAHRLDRLAPGSIVINTSRGSVVDDAALEAWARATGGRAVLDVWEGEPHLRWSLLRGEPSPVRLATPHVAGYTCEGKVEATAMVHRALMQWLGRPVSFDAVHGLGATGAEPLVPCPREVLPNAAGDDGRAALARCLLAIAPLHRDDASVRALLELPEDRRPRAFEMLRKGYALRREASHFCASGELDRLPAGGLSSSVTEALGHLGVGLAPC